MSNREKWIWSIYAGVLILLFLMSSTDLIIKEKEVEILPISVIIEDASDDYYVNFKKGMDKAAEEFHGDVSFITLYGTNDQEQQMELVQREIRDGARAVILTPVNEAETVMALDAMSPNCPVILLGAPVPSDFVVDTISVDSFAMGEMLAEAAALKAPKGAPIYLLTEGLAYADHTNVYDGVRTVLDEHGLSHKLIEKKTKDTFRQLIEETVYPGESRITIIAMDTQSLDEVAQIVDASTVYQSHVAGLYGIGSTNTILNSLDKGVIDGLTAYNQFDMGYMSVKRAVEAIQGGRQRRQIQLKGVYVDRDNLWDKTYEKMFYPIE